MEKLAPERKAEVKKMSVFRLFTKCEQAWCSPDQLELMDRNALLEAWAEIVLVSGDKVTASATKPSTASSSLTEVERQRLNLILISSNGNKKKRRKRIKRRESFADKNRKKRRERIGKRGSFADKNT